MSVYTFDRPRNLTEVVFATPDGMVPQCGHSHRSRPDIWSYRSSDTRPEATTAWVTLNIDSKAEAMVFACKTHTATIKAQQSKGSHGWRERDVQLLPESPAEAVKDMQRIFARVTGAILHAKLEREARMAERDLAYTREGWEKERAAYAARRGTTQNATSLTGVSEDYFGRVFIAVDVKRLTPGEARDLALRLVTIADEAEALTLAQVKP